MFKLIAWIFRWYLKKSRTQQRLVWNRDLPFGDSVSDRWIRASELGFGEGTSIYDSAIVLGNVQVGIKSWIGPNVILDGSGSELKIGSFCSISAGVQIYTHNSVLWSLSGGISKAEVGSVEIQDNCYIGPNVVISKGVKIGHGTVIGANSFVNSDVPANSRAWGVPARISNQDAN